MSFWSQNGLPNESKSVKKGILLAFSVFGTLLKNRFSDFVFFLPYLKGRPCDSMQTLHALARFWVFALFGSQTPHAADFV